MTYHRRLLFLALIDSTIAIVTVFFSYFMVNARVDVLQKDMAITALILLISHHLFFSFYKLYKKAWEYASVGELVIILKAITLSIVATAIAQKITIGETYFRLFAMIWMIHVLLIGGSRFIWRMYRDTYIQKKQDKKRTLIIGAGNAGNMIAKQLLHTENELLPVAFIDDSLSKQNLEICGLPVQGGRNDIQDVVTSMEIDHIIMAIPSLFNVKATEANEILQLCVNTNVKVQILRMVEDLVDGKVSTSIRDVQVEDLLGREQVELDISSIEGQLKDSVVLVTGAGGSIGSEICRQIFKFSPEKLVLLGHGENSIHEIKMELESEDQFREYATEIVSEIVDIQDKENVMRVMQLYKPNIVYHAAAHKHVPLMEHNPEAAIKNNMLGTKNVAEAASWAGVDTFVMVSTDKAVNPTNVMGSTKRLAEMIVQHINQESQTKFVAVRFGNVLGSRGSVVPIFKKQIQRGGPVKVTHPDIERYFMTIPEASRLVIQAGALAQGGEIFVLDMGNPVKIADLAQNMILLSGYTLNEIAIEYTGLRPGEKMFEELLLDTEKAGRTVHPKIYVGKTSEIYMDDIQSLLATYEHMPKEYVMETLKELANRHPVPEMVSM